MTILNYHGFNRWQTYLEKNDDLNKNFTFGFELEVTNLNNDDEEICEELVDRLSEDFCDFFVYEHDSSIENGVEIISQPMSWNWFLNHLDMFKKLLETCSNYDFDSHNGNLCGLHVHVGRQSLKGLDMFDRHLDDSKVIANINFILERYQEEIFKFSRRDHYSNRYCRARTDLISQENGLRFINKDQIKSLGIHQCDRYHSLNLSNGNTVEFRFLRGTLKWETFFISMNLIKNIVEFSRIPNHSVTFENLVFNGLDEESWVEYAKEYCSKRGIDLNDLSTKRPIFLENVYSDNLDIIFSLDKEQLVNSILDEE